MKPLNSKFIKELTQSHIQDLLKIDIEYICHNHRFNSNTQLQIGITDITNAYLTNSFCTVITIAGRDKKRFDEYINEVVTRNRYQPIEIMEELQKMVILNNFMPICQNGIGIYYNLIPSAEVFAI